MSNENRKLTNSHQQLVDLLKYSRKVIGYKQLEVSQRTGFATSVISSYENGVFLPSIFYLTCISEVLDIDINLLLSLYLQSILEKNNLKRSITFSIDNECT